MKGHNKILRTVMSAIMLLMTAMVSAQTTDSVAVAIDTVAVDIDSVAVDIDSVALGKILAQKVKPKKDWNKWRPNPKRAMWLAIVLPGAGQIYNRKYWKLPIVYGGFIGCLYAATWNNQMYHDYEQAYMDIMDDNPQTQSYNQFLHLGKTVDETNIEDYKSLFKRRKDYYRRYRDLSIFIMIGVYALSIIDAYVDASLSEFDISDDLSLRIQPAVIKNGASRNPFENAAMGVNCALTF